MMHRTLLKPDPDQALGPLLPATPDLAPGQGTSFTPVTGTTHLAGALASPGAAA